MGYWDTVTSLALVFTAFVTPFEIGFMDPLPTWQMAKNSPLCELEGNEWMDEQTHNAALNQTNPLTLAHQSSPKRLPPIPTPDSRSSS